MAPISQIRTGGGVIFKPSEGHPNEGQIPVEPGCRTLQITERLSVVEPHIPTSHCF